MKRAWLVLAASLLLAGCAGGLESGQRALNASEIASRLAVTVSAAACSGAERAIVASDALIEAKIAAVTAIRAKCDAIFALEDQIAATQLAVQGCLDNANIEGATKLLGEIGKLSRRAAELYAELTVGSRVMWASIASILSTIAGVVPVVISLFKKSPAKPVGVTQVDRAQVARDRAMIDAAIKGGGK